MQSFVQRHAASVIGVLQGFDRLVFRGTIRSLMHSPVMRNYLCSAGVLLKDFGNHVLEVTGQIRQAVAEVAWRAERPNLYLPSPQTSKEELARAIARRDGVREGLIAVLRCVEPCLSYQIHRNADTRLLELRLVPRRCLHLYQYHIHPQFGFMHVRLASWFPFSIQVVINGREWLARQMDQAGISYQRRDNCFAWIEDVPRAQHLCDEHRRTGWPIVLDALAAQANPVHAEVFGDFPARYYWSVFQSEYATDVMFHSAAALARLYPALVHHGITTFRSPDVLRFLGRKEHPRNPIPANFQGEVVSDVKQRPEGVRIKHRVNGNSIKLYDKQGSVLRVETTIQDPTDFKVYRPKEGGAAGDCAWRCLRKGIADLDRRADVSAAANDRYLEALAAVETPTPFGPVVEALCRPTIWEERRFRALNPFAAGDAALLQAVYRGEFLLNGFRNRDLQRLLFAAPAATPAEARRRSAAVTRQLRLLRAHGLIKKVTGTHRYLLTIKGRTAIAAVLAAQQIDIAKLNENAA